MQVTRESKKLLELNFHHQTIKFGDKFIEMISTINERNESFNMVSRQAKCLASVWKEAKRILQIISKKFLRIRQIR